MESRTDLTWRGKGSPTIYEMYTERVISKLIVITNKVYLDFDSKNFVNLHENFSGTYFYWEIDRNCINKTHIDK